METALKSQLNKLKLSQKSQPLLPSRSEASFLFDLEHSKRIDIDTIYELGYSGLIDLARHKEIFVKYFNSILNSTSKYFNRETKRGEDLKQVDENLNELIVQLIPYFRQKPTHKILEYLIRIYNVNVYNKKILMLAFLPYHETKFFAKLIQIINFDQFNHLKFFSNFGKEGKVVLREFLYKELNTNFDMLREIFNFYDEHMLTLSNIELNDSIYLNFIFDICEYLLRNTSKAISIDFNRLNLIIQFLNKIFKFFKSKTNAFNRANYEDEGEYEISLVTNTSRLINTLTTKLSISAEYKKAFVNDLINKFLVSAENEASFENILRTILTILSESESNNKNQKDTFIQLGKEAITNLGEIYVSKRHFRQILRNISERNDIALLIKTILLSSHENINLVKSLIRDNDFRQENLQRLIIFLYDKIGDNSNEVNKDYTDLLYFIEEIHSEKFNSILINLFTNTRNEDYVKKLKEITSKINKDYQVLLNNNSSDVNMNSNEINAFNLFLNLNNTNINTVISSIRKIDDIYVLSDNEQKSYLMSKIVPSLVNKFAFLDKEIVLSEIISLKHISQLIKNYPLFKNEFVNFFFTFCEKQIDLYSNQFISLYLNVLLLNYIDKKDPLGFKALIYLILFKFEKEALKNENAFGMKLLSGDSDYSVFVDYLYSYENETINGLKFFEAIRDILTNLEAQKNNNIDSKLMLELIEKILIKEKEKISSNKSKFYRLLEIVLEILNLEYTKLQYNNELFKSLSTILIKIFNSISDFSAVYASEIEVRNILNKFAYILISNNNLSHFDSMNKSVFINPQNIQKFLTYLILNSNNLNEPFYNYVRNNITSWDSAEICLVTALIYATTNTHESKSVHSILEILNDLNNKKLNSSNYNKFSVDYQAYPQNELEPSITIAYSDLVDDLLSRKNEIIVNRGNLKKFIFDLINEKVFETILLIFVKDANILNLKSITKVLELFSSNKNKKNYNPSRQSQILDLSLTFIKGLASNSKIRTDEKNHISFIKLTQLIFENLFNLYNKSVLNIIQVLITISNEFRFDQEFVERFFSKDNFELSEEIKQNQHQLHKIIKFALAYSIPPETFVANDDEYCKNILNHILNEKLIQNKENEFFIIYSFEIILRSKNYYFDLNYVKLTTDLLETIHQQGHSNSESNTVYLNVSNNLLTILSNNTIESEEKKELKPIINKLEQIIFHLVNKFRNVEIEMSQSLELAHIMNTLFLCINKLTSNFDFIQEESEYVKNLIVRCFEILNVKSDNENGDDVDMTDLTQKTKEEVYMVFLNAIKNFIELIFTKQNLLGAKNEVDRNRIFYEYIHYFVKFSILNIKDKKILEMFLSNFIKIPMILSSEDFLACYFVNLFYFTIDINFERNEKNFYSQIIFNFYKQEDEESKLKNHMLRSLNIISSIFEELNRNNESIFCLESEDIKTRPDPNFISLNLIRKIFILAGDNFAHLESSNDPNLLNTILKVCNSINLNRKITTSKMRKNENSEGNNEIYKIHLNELKSFEKELFSTLTESKIIYNAILLIYENCFEDSHRGYLLNKFNEIIIAKENFDSVNIPRLLEFFIENLRKEDKVDNLQLIFSILTKITRVDENESKEIFRILKTKNNFDYILSLVKFSSNNENNKNLQIQFYHFSILVFVTKVFNVLPQNKFLDKFNQFINIFNKGLSVVLEIQNEDLTSLILESFYNLSLYKSEFLSPFLKEILHRILLITDKSVNGSNFTKIQSIINNTFETIAKKQLFDNSFKSVKYCIQNLSAEVGVETFKVIFNYFKTSLEQTDKVVLANMYEKIFKFFVKLLIDEKMNERLSESILDCFKTFILKINEKQLRTIFQNILIFGKEKSEGETSIKYKLGNSIVTFQILNTILKSISIVFVIYFEKYKGYWTDLINSVCSIFSTEDKRNSNKKKKSRIEFDEAYDNDKRTFSYLKLNSLLLENIKLNFKFNKENSLLNETIEDLFESLSAELKFIFFESNEEKYLKYFEEEIKISFIEIFRNLRSDDHLKEFNDSILNLIREDHYLIKLLALKMIYSLFLELKERYITLLSNILPYVSDCLEDSNEKVHAEAFKIIKYVEKETGEDLKYYLEG